jgi:drug/metabolite transporter (DMT)-like permease
MELYVFGIVIFAAMLHALWNFVTKKISGNLTVIWIGLCGSSLLMTPVSLVLLFKEEATSSALPYIIATGLIHACYFYFIGKSYEKGAISIVYPVARGVGVFGTAITATFFLSEMISAIGGAGILLVCSGVLSIGLRETATRESKRAFYYALIVGVLITGYSTVDKVGVSLINPLVYIWAMFSIAAICLAPVVLMMDLNKVREIWNRMKWASGIIGLGSITTYLLILYAFRLGNVSYAVAVREFAVVIGAALGVVFLGEKLTKQKVVGIAAIIVGLILIKLA